MKSSDNKIVRGLLVAAGTLSLALGVIGIFVPLLPTTVFLLMAAACYGKSSPRFYNWLINNKFLGRYINDYRAGKGVPVRVKVVSITFLWLTILSSVIFFTDLLLVRILLLVIAAGVTIHILLIRTRRRDVAAVNEPK